MATMENAEEEIKDDDTGPNCLDCIEENLWLGNLAGVSNFDAFENKVSSVLTVDAWPLPKKVANQIKNVNSMCISVTDLPTEDLISHFESAYDFITEGVKEGTVLVHCYQGVSRSVAVVLAYLMRKNEITLQEAFELTKSKRKFIQPNQGFMAQLKLYETMRFQIDDTNMQYKMFRLYVAADRIRALKSLPEKCADVIKPDPYLEPTLADPRVYRCRKCRRILASEANIMPHLPRDKYTWRDERYSTGEGSEDYCQKIYFVEPMTWMKTVADTLVGKLYCPNPKCQMKLGSYCWNMGSLCPCGTKVSPAFYLVPSKVDKAIVIQQVEETVNNDES